MVRIIICIISIAFTANISAQNSIVLAWDYRDARTGEWYSFGEHGTIQERLMQRDFKSWFFLNKEEAFEELEHFDWELVSSFFIDSNQLNSSWVISLPSVDTYAQVFLNNTLVGNTSNAFHPYRFKLDSVVRMGENIVKLVLTPPVKYHEEHDEYSIDYPAPNDVAKVKVASLTRKPQYHFGWDWTMRINTIGLNAPVCVEEYDPFLITDFGVETVSMNGIDAKLKLKINFQDSIIGEYRWVSDQFGEHEIKSKNNLWSWEVTQSNAALWWPRGQGDQYMYEDKWVVYNSDNQVVKEVYVKYGIRYSKLIQEADEIGVSYKIELNDRYIFCKGANYIPPSIFNSEIDSARIKADIEAMVKSNFNMIRVWGGGMYLPDYFYELCDYYGIMVWQDLMFACAMYPANELFKDELKQELNYQIPRLSHHPCVVLFNGNNEVEVAYKFWGLKDALGISEEDWSLIGKEKDELFKRFIPDLVHSLTVVPYVYTSPLSNWGASERFNSGSQHYWGVWHGSEDPFLGFSENIGRFNSEYGYQSFPQLSTISSFAKASELDLDSEIMKVHQKSYVGNEKILNHIKEHYRKPKNFADFVYLSQILQAESIQTAISAHRLATDRCSGTLYWQFNDCYPGPTWSGIDYFGNWKAMQYKVRDAFRDQVVLKSFDGAYFWLNDVPDSTSVELKIEFTGNDGYYRSVNVSVNSAPNQKTEIIIPGKFERKLSAIGGMIDFSWIDINGSPQKSSFSYRYSKRFIFEPTYEVYSYDKNTKEGYLLISTKGFLKDLWIQDLQGMSVFNQNFIDILKGEYLIKFYRDTEPANDDFILNWN